MKAYKVELIVVDHEGYGSNTLKQNIEDMRYYNPMVISIVDGEIGDWTDFHPLNYSSTPLEEKLKYFN